MDRIAAKQELIASAAQDHRTWNLYTQQGEFFDQDPPTWQDLSGAEEILIKRRDWRARKRLLAYASRRLRQERITTSEPRMLENTLTGTGRLG
ncbi:MAG: hypothetical protein JO279_16430 [Verrucomicrobia bacterium]|nr:hypothetical protein [Verrucomicrobiota bacterium]